MKNQLTIALIGNPNCGKTSLFNVLTGSRQHVGNWPGVTVERIEGVAKYQGENIKIVDLPGIYGLSASSEDEMVAVSYIMQESPDVVINVVDSTNFERNLYLTMQLLEMNAKLIIALNMTDEAKKKQIWIEEEKPSALLDVPVVATVATRRTGIDKLLEQALNIKNREKKPWKADFGPETNEILAGLEEELTASAPKGSSLMAVIKLLEDERYAKELLGLKEGTSFYRQIESSRNRIRELSGLEPDIYFAEKRYEFIARIVKECVKQEAPATMDLTERIDRIATNKWLGIPIFFLVMFLMYQFTMGFGNDFLGSYVSDFFAFLGTQVNHLMAESPSLVRSFVVEGIIGGVGSVLAFVPLMFTMYFLISFLEDTGYMARAAYVMDRLMIAMGLHGKTAVSMIVSSGCNVAGIMSTRTLDSYKDRMIGILISPFVSCSARLPVYALFAGFFRQ
jgi:ferrous iron transport protein B